MRFIDLTILGAISALLSACGGVQLPNWFPPDADAPATTTAAARPGQSSPSAGPSSAASRNWDDYRVKAAQRIVAANPDRAYMGKVPDILLAIPVIEVELNSDGGVRRLVVRRYPGQAEDTVPLALAAIRRAAPFGDVSHLPRPWKFTEVFLFNDDRRFKPRSLDD